MDIKLNFGNYNDYRIDDARISLMVSGDEKNAVKMSVWEKIKDFFRADKKSDAYQTLYHLLHDTECGDKLDSFNKLKSFATPECQGFFEKEIRHDEVLFFIKNEKVGQSSLQKLMNISEQTPLKMMSEPEQLLFLEMIDTLRQKETLYSDSYSGFIRKKMSVEHYQDLLDLYRPQEDIDCPGTELVKVDFLNYKEKAQLYQLNNSGSTRLPDQFSSIGYQNTASGVKFSMVHPSISYLLETYSKSYYDGEPSTDFNSAQMNMLNKIYYNYNYNKNEIDLVLHKVYEIHGGTLNISSAGYTGNRIVSSPLTERAYLFQSAHSLQDLSDSLDTVFHKWTAVEDLTS